MPRDDRPFRGSVLAAFFVIVLGLLGTVVTVSWLFIATGVLTWR
ncbi:hypothetical protein [Leifsonia sp. ZF2019]|nr:hypothetical protein [Leifsonia sp. ZF2019]